MTQMDREDTSIRVLLVDDDSKLLDLTAMRLEREADQLNIMTETSAADGLARLNDGLARLSNNGIDCIVSDYQMPDMDGLDFLEAVRAEYPTLPFILYTGKGSEEIAAQAINAGVDAYHQKETGSGQYTVLAQHITTLVEKARAEQRLDYIEREKHIADGSGAGQPGGPGSSRMASLTEVEPVSSAESISMEVVKTVAEREGVDPVALDPPLHEAINTDALDHLFGPQPAETDQPPKAVAFTYQGYTITAYNNGRIDLDK